MMKKLALLVPSLNVMLGLAGAFFVAPAFAQDTNAPTEMKPTVVTGSYIPTAETVGPAPVETVNAAKIQQTGAQDILTALRTVSPVFSGSGNIGQTLNNGGYGEAYIAIRNLPTLVLVDGKRLNVSPFSAYIFTGGAPAVDVNTIPIAMIDRIEVLKDGASTLYGSDAIGGVVNIITKKGFNGAQFDGHYGFGMDQGTYNEYRADAMIGYDKNGTRAIVGAQYYYSDPLLTSDRPIGGLTPQELGAQNIHVPTYFSPSYPGRVSSFLLAGSPLAQGAVNGLGQSEYIPGLNAPPVIAGGPFATVQAYNTAALTGADPTWRNYLAAHSLPATLTPYIPITDTPTSKALGGSPAILNTTEFGTYSLQKQDRWNAFANLEQDIFEDRLTAYGQVMWSHNESTGRLAPAPIPALTIYGITVPANNPYNVFGETLGAGQTAGPAARSRLVETGPRNFISDSEWWHFMGGFKGNIVDNYHYDVNAAYSQTSSHQLQNSASSDLLNLALAPGAGGLSQLGTPIYNILALPGFNDPATVSAIKASANQGGFTDLLDTEGVFRGDLFELPGGMFQLAIGAQYIRDSMSTTADPLLQSGHLIGLLALPPFSGGSRDREAGFAQAVIPVFKPEMNIPAFYSFEIDAEGRYEAVQWAGNSADKAVPKVGFRWQPLDEQITIRGTYSQGFVVPGLFQLFGPPVNSSPTVVTPTSATDLTPVAQQENVNYYSNPNIPPSTAETMTLGIVYSPKQLKALTVSVDYYHITQDNVPFNPSPSTMVADLNARGTGSVWWNTPFLPAGTPVYTVNGVATAPTPGVPSTYINADTFDTLNVPLIPGGKLRTDGIDFGLNYRLDTSEAGIGEVGIFNLFCNANVTMNYDIALPGTGFFSYKGQYTDVQVIPAAQGLIPDWNLTTGFTWSLCNFDWTVMAHYITDATDYGTLHPSIGAPSNNFTINGQPYHLPSYYKLDMQLAYNIRSESGKKWYDNTRIAIGCNNVTDQLPPLIASSSEDNTDKASYDIIGRFLYVELNKKF